MQMDWKYTHYINQLRRTTKKVHENFVVSSMFHDPELRDLRPYTQFYVKRSDSGYALIDLYYPSIDIAIEIDEPYHEGNSVNDEIRERIVTDEISCEFHRISVSGEHILEQIEVVKSRIKEKLSDYKNGGKFENWKEPRVVEMEQLRSELANTIFVRVIGEVHPNDLYERETGIWKLAEYNRIKIDQAVVVHNGMITRVFIKLKWERLNEGVNAWRFDADEDEHNKYVGTFVAGWKSQGSFRYSADISA